jgi:hypothetical protein
MNFYLKNIKKCLDQKETVVLAVAGHRAPAAAEEEIMVADIALAAIVYVLNVVKKYRINRA